MVDRHWWVALGYPDFDEGTDGFPRPGQVLKHYRYLKKKDDAAPWTQGDLAYVLGTSEQTIRDMENRDRGFTLERRRFLIKLFAIPSVLYGVVTLEEVTQQLAQRHAMFQGATISTTKKVMVDIVRCRELLTEYQEANYARGGPTLIQDASGWIALLDEEVSSVSDSQQRRERYELLIGFHCLMATILRDLYRFEQALPHANKAVEIAEQLEDDLHYPIALCRRGKIWLDQTHVWNDPHLSHTALEAATCDFQRAIAFKEKLPLPVQSSLLLNAGHAQARSAQLEKERTEALRMMDQAANIARTSNERGSLNGALKIEVGRCHLDKGDALMALGRANDAIQEFSLIGDSANQRRNAYRDVYLAQAYLQKKDYDYAARLASDALPKIKEIHANICTARIVDIHKQLEMSSFRNNPEVARLGWLLIAR